MIQGLMFFSFSYVLLFPLLVNAHASESNESMSTSAFMAIRQADESGADTADLVSRFNQALYFIEQSETSDSNSCPSSEECLRTAEELFASIVRDAEILQEKPSSMLPILEQIIRIGGILIASFAMSFIATYFYIQWKSLQLKRFLDMEIRTEDM